MPSCKQYKQLKLGMEPATDHYEGVLLSFRLHNQFIKGFLYGTISDWVFYSSSSVFLKYIPAGILPKYALWIDKIPVKLTEIYNGIFSAASKAGYKMEE